MNTFNPEKPDVSSVEKNPIEPEVAPETTTESIEVSTPEQDEQALDDVRADLATRDVTEEKKQTPEATPTPTSRSAWESIRDIGGLIPWVIEQKQRLTRGKETKAIIDLLDAKKQDKILEIGCNRGYLLDQLHKQAGVGENYVALDQKIQNTARKRAARTGAQVTEKDGTQTGFDSGSFDKIVTSHVLEHFDEPATLLDEIDRLLTDDGVVVIAVPRETKHSALNPMGWPSKFRGHKKYFNKPEVLIQLLEENGFEIEGSWDSRTSIVIKAKKQHA